MSSLGTANSGTVYGSAPVLASAPVSVSASVPVSASVSRERSAHRVDPRLAITVSSLIAAVLTMLGAASILAGLSGVVGIEPLGLFRTACYLGLGFAGAGSGGLLLIVLGDLRTALDAGSSAGPASG